MANTVKKAQQLQKKGAGILTAFQQAETDLLQHITESESLRADIEAEIATKQALLTEVTEAQQSSKTVLQNVRDFLGKQ